MRAMLIPADVRAIFFDAVGTLIYPEPSAPHMYAQVGRRHGSQRNQSTIVARFHKAFEREEEIDRAAQWRTSEAREVERWRAIVATVLDDVKDAESCFGELFAHFSRPEAWRANPDAAATLRVLSRRGYRLGIASNFDHRLRRVLAGHPGLGLAEHIVVSSEVGWRKPASEFFAALCKQVRLPAEQILLVGNDMINDYDGARTAHLHAVLFDTEQTTPGRQQISARRLSELLG